MSPLTVYNESILIAAIVCPTFTIQGKVFEGHYNVTRRHECLDGVIKGKGPYTVVATCTANGKWARKYHPCRQPKCK